MTDTPLPTDDWLVGDPAANAAWDAIMSDDRLRGARRRLSLHELRLIIGHAARPTPKASESEVERVARAIYETRPSCTLWDELDASTRQLMLDKARAAIAALAQTRS